MSVDKENMIKNFGDFLNNVKKVWSLKINPEEILIIQVPEDRYSKDMDKTIGEIFRYCGIDRVVIDPIGCDFKTIKKESVDQLTHP